MICKKCGKYNPDHNQVCMYCGGVLGEKKEENSFYNGSAWGKSNAPKYVKDRTLIGYLFCIFFGVLGLIIGLLCFSDPAEKESFRKAWVDCFVILLVIAGIIGLIVGIIFWTAIGGCNLR